MLKQLKATKHGIPYNMTEKKWNSIMDDMIWAFEQITLDNNDDQFWTDGIDWDGMKVHYARINKGTALFGKYYRSLWD